MSDNRFLNTLLSKNKSGVLTKDEEMELINDIKSTGSERSKTKLIKAHYPFIVSVARGYQNRGLQMGDLVSEGSLGFIKAIDSFDSTKGFRFLTYAKWWIKEGIQKAIEENRLVSIPQKKMKLIRDFKKALLENGNDYEKTINMVQFAEFKHEIHEFMGKTEVSSLDAPVNTDDGEITLADKISADPSMIAPVESTSEYAVRSVIKDICEKIFDSREMTILNKTYGFGCRPHTNEEIGKTLGLSGERVRQIRVKIHGKMLKHPTVRKALYGIFYKN